jgi:hypothetical protein
MFLFENEQHIISSSFPPALIPASLLQQTWVSFFFLAVAAVVIFVEENTLWRCAAFSLVLFSLYDSHHCSHQLSLAKGLPREISIWVCPESLIEMV